MKKLGIWVTCFMMLPAHCASTSVQAKIAIPTEISGFVDLAQRRKIHNEFVQASRVCTGSVCNTVGESFQSFLSRAVVQDYLAFENIGAQQVNMSPFIALLANSLQERLQDKINLSEAVPCDYNEKARYWRDFHARVRTFLAQELEAVVSLKQDDLETMVANTKQRHPVSLLNPFQEIAFAAALVVMARMLEYNYRIDTVWFCAAESGIDYKSYLA